MEKKKYKAERDGYYGIMPKMTVMAPTVENVSNPPEEESVSLQGLLCRYGNPEKYKDCVEYNTAFCRCECEFGAKEKRVDEDILLPDIEGS